MYKLPYFETNLSPSNLNTNQPSGVAAQLATLAKDPPVGDGVTIEQMRGNPLYDRIDDIDKEGLAKKALKKSVDTLKTNQKKIRAINELGERMKKPKRSA